MANSWIDIETGKSLDGEYVTELERDLFLWGVLPDNQGQVLDRIQKHIQDMGAKQPLVELVTDSEAPKDTSEYIKDDLVVSDPDMGEYVHFWIHRATNQIYVAIIRPDLHEPYAEPPEDTPDEFIWDIDAQNRAARFGEEG